MTIPPNREVETFVNKTFRHKKETGTGIGAGIGVDEGAGIGLDKVAYIGAGIKTKMVAAKDTGISKDIGA